VEKQDSLQSYKQLTVWQKAIDLASEIYRLTDKFPKQEQYGLTSQMRRAAISIPSNIAEGYKRRHRAEYLQFLSIANGSAAELETQLILARRLLPHLDGDFSKSECLLDEILKMLYVMSSRLK